MLMQYMTEVKAQALRLRFLLVFQPVNPWQTFSSVLKLKLKVLKGTLWLESKTQTTA